MLLSLFFIVSLYFTEPNTPDGHHASKDSNNLLFALLSEQLCSTYQRQVRLTQKQSQFFFDQLYARPRSVDLNPFSFEIEKFVSQSQEKGAEYGRAESVPKESGAYIGQSQRSSDIGSQGHGSQGRGQSQDTDVKVIPEWNCFMKSVNNSALMLVFLPASYEDLVLLNEKTTAGDGETEVVNDMAEGDNEIAGACLDQSGKDDSVTKSEAEQSDQTSECVTAESDLETTTPTVETPKDDSESEISVFVEDQKPIYDKVVVDVNEVHEHAEGESNEANIVEEAEKDDKINEKKKTASKPLVLPVYIYDCVIHSVLDSLINPWDFQLPADTYQDMTFDFPEETTDIGGRIKRVSFSVDNLKVSE